MENTPDEKRAERFRVLLRLLSAAQVVAGVGILSAALLLPGPETLVLASRDIGMPAGALAGVTASLLLLVTASGLVSLSRVRYGWFSVFFVAALLLLMAVLQGPGTIPLTIASFIVLLALSGLSWALAVVYYFWDLYT